MAIAIFEQHVSVHRMNIPENDRIILSDLADHRIVPLFDIHALCNMIFILPSCKFPKDILYRALTVHQKQLPRRKRATVNQITQPAPQPCKHQLIQHHRHHMPPADDKPAVHQGQLRIADYIDAQKRKQLRQENIQRFQIADFECSISIGKEKEQYEIQCNNQQMTVYIKTVMCFPCNMMIIIGEPVVRIKSSQHAQSNQPKRQNNQPLDRIVFLHLPFSRYILLHTARTAHIQKHAALAITDIFSCFR